MNKLDYAKTFLNQGIAVIPLQHRGKNPEASMIGGTWEQYKTLLPTEYQVNSWLFSTWQNYGVVAGWGGLAFLDFDTIDAFAMWLDWFLLLNKHIEVYPMPYIVRSSRGAHVYMRCPTITANEKRLGVDVKCHGYVVGPGSIHPSGVTYEPITEFRLIDVFSLDTILPDGLFPRVAPVVATMPMEPMQFDLFATEYDPFATASTGADYDLIAKVKSAVRIESLFADTRKTSTDGRWLACLCPFHDDHNPSAWIDTRRQLFGCNSCGFKPMDAINLYARMHNCSESAAVSALAKEVGVWG